MTDAANAPPTTRAARVITIVATLCAFCVTPYALVRGTIGRR
ncbi:hypothetical protein ACH4TP_31400 [Streptomyces sp. NPDC021012]